MRYGGLALIVCTITVACSGGESSVRQRFLAQSSVSVLFDTWVRCNNNQDRDSLALLYHHVRELRVLRPDGTVTRGWNEEREAQAEFFDSVERVNFLAEALEIEVVDKDVVLTTFHHSLDAERRGGERLPTVSGVGTMVWVRDAADGQWKIHMLHLSAR
jgi:ketosteroid isomerase-like protein